MKKLIYALKDVKTANYMNPMVYDNEINAVRDMNIVVNRMEDSQVYHYPEDYELYQVGEFDTQIGALVPFTSPKFVVCAISLKKQETPKNDSPKPEDENYHGQ